MPCFYNFICVILFSIFVVAVWFGFSVSLSSINTKVVNTKTLRLVRTGFSIIKDCYVSVLSSALGNPCSTRVPFFTLRTLNLIRFYLISAGFKYTFMPNFATTREVGERYFKHLHGNNLRLLS